MQPTPTPPAYAPPPRQAPAKPRRRPLASTPTRDCSGSPTGAHDTWGGTVCAWCGTQPTPTRSFTEDDLASKITEALEPYLLSTARATLIRARHALAHIPDALPVIDSLLEDL